MVPAISTTTAMHETAMMTMVDSDMDAWLLSFDVLALCESDSIGSSWLSMMPYSLIRHVNDVFVMTCLSPQVPLHTAEHEMATR
jgi:hypothetical protein